MNLDELWGLVLTEVEIQVSRANFSTWIKNSRLVESKDGVFYVALPNNFAKEWVESKYQKMILGVMRNIENSAKKVEFLVRPETEIVSEKKFAVQDVQPMQNRMDLSFSVDPGTNLNSKYTLDSFVVGPSNELAFAAASAIADEIGTKYNPFFVYGGVGLGKTHLIQGIGNAVSKKHQGKVKTCYVTSEKFTNDIVWSIRNKRIEDVKKKYRGYDVLIIDDIQFIGGKEKTMEEFFHTFNALYENNKQIIISSDRPPRSLSTLDDRLRSRFEGGLTADIGYPDYETRVAIVREKLKESGRVLADGVVELIAEKVKKNVRELEGVLNKVLFCQDIKKEDLDMGEVNDVIEKATKNTSKRVSDDEIMSAVAEFFSIAPEDLTKRTRKREVVEPRQITMYLFRDILDMSYPFIGEKMGRDHTTAIHAVEKIKQEINKNSSLSQKVNLIKDTIYKE